MTEREIEAAVVASQAGDVEAFGALVRQYEALVSAVVIARLGDIHRAEDVAQDAFVSAWKAIGTLEDPARFRSWLCSIARNSASNSRRKYARELLVSEPPEPVDEDDGLQQLLEKERRTALTEALGAIPEDDREILVLFYREEQSIREVARSLAVTESAAQKRISRGRNALRSEVTTLLADRLPGAAGVGIAAAVIASISGNKPAAAGTAAASTTTKGVIMKIALASTIVALAGTGIYMGTATGTPDDDNGSDSTSAAAASKTKTKSAKGSATSRSSASSKRARKRRFKVDPSKKAQPPARAPGAKETRRERINRLKQEIEVGDGYEAALKVTFADPEFKAMTADCFNLAKANNPKLFGNIRFEVMATSDPEVAGRVTDVKASLRTRGFNPPLRNYEECMTELLLSLEFVGLDKDRTFSVPFYYEKPHRWMPEKATEDEVIAEIKRTSDPQKLNEILWDRFYSHPRATRAVCDKVLSLGDKGSLLFCVDQTCKKGEAVLAQRYFSATATAVPPGPRKYGSMLDRNDPHLIIASRKTSQARCKLKGIVLK